MKSKDDVEKIKMFYTLIGTYERLCARAFKLNMQYNISECSDLNTYQVRLDVHFLFFFSRADVSFFSLVGLVCARLKFVSLNMAHGGGGVIECMFGFILPQNHPSIVKGRISATKNSTHTHSTEKRKSFSAPI